MNSIASMLLKKATPMSEWKPPRTDSKESKVAVSRREQYEKSLSMLLQAMESWKKYTADDLAAMVGCSKAAVYKYLVELLFRGKVQRAKRGSQFEYWRL